MRHPSAPNNNGQAQRARTRGAIRTHLGRKRSGPRVRNGTSGVVRMEPANSPSYREQEALFDRLLGQFQSLFGAAGERTVAALDGALESACNTLVTAGEFTAENAQRLRDYVRRDVLHREQPTLTFRTGDITTAGTLNCENCGWLLVANRTTLLPPCPQCGDTVFRKTA
jgi:hypothetical protein